MSAPWVPPGRAPERILGYGPEGAGKSFVAGCLARRMPSTSRMFIIDTDFAWTPLCERVFQDLPIEAWYERGKKVEGLAREGEGAALTVWQPDGWVQTAAALNAAFGAAVAGDWIVPDSTSDMWDDISDYYTQQICGKDLPKFILEWRKKMEAVGDGNKAARQGTQGPMLEEGLWDYVNPEWHRVMSRPFKSSMAHVYATAQASTINPKDGGGIKDAYDSFGMKPRTQKKMGNNAATVMLMGKTKTGKRQFSIVKNWGREDEEMPRDQVYDDMSKELLFKYGWRPAKTAR